MKTAEEMIREKVVELNQRRARSEQAGGAAALRIDAGEWDEAAIPQRPWIARGYLLTGSVSLIAGAGAAGKSMLSIGYAIALATGRKWGRFAPTEACRVSIFNAEDDEDEQRRRMSAALRQHNMTPAAVAGKIARIGPNGTAHLLELSPETGRMEKTPAWDALVAHIDDFKPAVLILDPLIEMHRSRENGNDEMRAVIAELRALAVEKQIAVLVVHHVKKGSTDPGDADSIRGGGAIVGAVRVALTCCVMSEEESQRHGIPAAERSRYFRVDGAKQNYSPASEADWYEKVTIELANGDDAGAAVPWKPTTIWQRCPTEELNRALDLIDAAPADDLYSPSQAGRSNDRWCGRPIMLTLGCTAAEAKHIVDTWLRTGALVATRYRNARQRREQTGVKSNPALRPGTVN